MRALALILVLASWAPLAAAQPEDPPEAGEIDAEGEAGEEAGDEAEADAADAEADDAETTELDASDEPDEVAGAAVTGEQAESPRRVDPLGDEMSDEATGTPPWVAVGGYMEPGFGVRYRPEGLPRDELSYGFFGRAGLVVDARPFSMWRARLNVVFDSNVLAALTDVQLVDTDGDGTAERTRLTRRQVPGTLLQEATVDFIPAPWFEMRAGALRIPFSLQQQAANTALMFPTRSAPNEIFLSGADFGIIAAGNFFDGIFLASAGIFSGESLGLGIAGTVSRGPVFSFRADVNPFGGFDFGGGGPARGPFRLGIGGGALVRPAIIFDENTGTEPRSVVDTRLAASIRMAVRGLYVAAEYFRRQQTDDFTFRPEVADGAYAQVAMFIPVIESFGVEPAARAGFVAQDQTFDPRLTGFLEAGANLYPVADVGRGGAVRFTLQYLGERRFTEREEAHGGRVAVRMKF